MKKILWLPEFLPFPLNTGFKNAVFNLLKPMSKENEITLISFVHSSVNPDQAHLLKKCCKTIVTIPLEDLKYRPNRLSKKIPHCMSQFSPLMEKAINDALAQDFFDVVIVEGLSMAQYLTSKFNGLSIYRAHDVEALKYKSLSQRKKGLRTKIWRYLQYLKLKRYEIDIIKRFDLCITVSEHDRRVFRKWIQGVNIETVPIGISIEKYCPFRNIPKKENLISFCGTLNYPPNVDGLLYFYKKVYPYIRQKCPHVQLRVIGRKPPLDVLALRFDKSVEITGEVADIKPFLADCSISVAPIRLGGGSKVKIIQSMAMGLPVVTTPHGIEGIDVIVGRDLLVGSTPREFAKMAISLLTDQELREAVSRSARETIIKKYNREVIARQFTELIESYSKKI